jgi:hypothetical protein
MPCMNSTSACDRGGSVALVDGGSVRLGLPGAPGCTTTGFAGSICRAQTVEDERAPEVSNTPMYRSGDFTWDLGGRSRREFSLRVFSGLPRSNQAPHAATKLCRRLRRGSQHRPRVRVIAMPSRRASFGNRCGRADSNGDAQTGWRIIVRGAGLPDPRAGRALWDRRRKEIP